MGFYLEVTNGEQAGLTAYAESGDLLQVGSQTDEPMRLGADSGLAPRHFGVASDEKGIRFFDMGGGACDVNGTAVLTCRLRTGDVIRAGKVDFIVFDGPLGPRPEIVRIRTVRNRLLQLFQAVPLPLYAIVDAAKDDAIVSLLEASGLRYQSLYQGQSQVRLGHVAPYLVELDARSATMEHLIRRGWGRGWASYFTCTYSFESIRKHLRHFLMVKAPSGDMVYFRYYDPGVLRTFLMACSPSDLLEFFGPIGRFLVEAEGQPRTVLSIEMQGSRLQINKLEVKGS